MSYFLNLFIVSIRYFYTEGGTLEMATERVEGTGTDKEVVVPVVRTGATDHKCYVSWEAEDMTAVRGKHYRGGRGNLSFEPGEKRY